MAKKDLKDNRLIVVQGTSHPALFASSLAAHHVHWIGAPPQSLCRCTAKIRYRQSDQTCTVESLGDGTVRVVFDAPQRAITPQQSIVFYDGQTCLGGAFIAAPENP